MSRVPPTAFHPEKGQPTTGGFSRHEVELANRNSGVLLEALRHDVTPVGLHYLLCLFRRTLCVAPEK